MSKISKQLKINYTNMMKIDSEYQSLVTDIVCYIRSELTSYDAEEAINDINEILLGAQSRGENLFDIVGNYKEFCKDVISSYKDGVKNYKIKMAIENIPILIYAIVFFFALDIVTTVLSSSPASFSEAINVKYTITLAPIINSILSLVISIGVFKFIAKSSDSTVDSKKSNILFFISYIIITTILVASGMLGRKIELLTLNNISIPIIIAFLVVVAIVTLIKLPIQSRISSKKIS